MPSGADEQASSLRPDGATRGDLAEATALLVAGSVLLTVPVIAILDRMGSVWLWLSLAIALGGVLIITLGVRWFVTDGPTVVTTPASRWQQLAEEPVDLPVTVRLVDAQSRLQAHSLRFSALGAALVLLVFDVGVLKWAVVGLFLLSFVADHVLLRPRRYLLDDQGFRSRGLGSSRTVGWSGVTRVYWRHYPGAEQPPFPSGERVIVELAERADVEFVFSKRYGGTEAAVLVRALVSLLGDRVQVLAPRTTPRADVPTANVSELFSADEAREEVP